MEWYFAKDGRQLGPVDHDGLVRRIAAGEIAPTDLVWRDGMTDWTPAGNVPELSATFAETAVVEVPPAAVSGTGPASPYAPPAEQWSPPKTAAVAIPNYLWQSIVVTIFCCWPLGIPAIVHAARVDGLKARGDLAAAREASANAKMWCWISAAVWLLLVFLLAGGAI